MDDLRVADANWSPFLPFMSWLIPSLKPEVTVDLEFEVQSSFHTFGKWPSLRIWPRNASWCCSQSPGARTRGAKRKSADSRPSSRTLRHDSAARSKARSRRTTSSASGFPPIHLLHLALSDDVGRGPEYLQKWVDRLAPGGVLVLTTTSSGGTEYSATCGYVADKLPSTVIRLGPSAEIFVAQAPVKGGTPLVEFLHNAPAAFRGLFALLAERSEFRHLLGPEAASPSAIRALIDSLNESRHIERETFQFALDATRETMATLASQSGMLRDELIEYKEQARFEKAVMQEEYFGRLDELTAKLSTSAARYTRELTFRELALEAREREAEVLAGEAAEAQRRVAEVLRSSSWRLTAPLRLLSRLAGSGRAKDQLPRHD